MTNYIAYILKFIFRIKWWLILCPLIVAILVYLFMGRMPHTYKTTTTVYTGIVSGYSPDTSEAKQDWNIINNAMDNLINIIQSQTTLHEVSLRLYARNMSHGDLDHDNNYLTAEHYRAELGHTPEAVKKLIVRDNEEQTYENIKAFETASRDNHIYGLFHWTHPYYSFQALSQIKVKRVGTSDMLEISYENNDPGVVFNTLDILNDEFVKQYRSLRFGETNNVIAFFEAELRRVGGELSGQEDSLRDYSVKNQVINYEEQTKQIAAVSRDFELQDEQIKLDHDSAEQLRKTIEAQIDGLATFRNNAAFVERIHNISDLQSRITAAEAFMPTDASSKTVSAQATTINSLQRRLAQETDSLRHLTSAITAQRYTKEGLATSSYIQQWLDAVLTGARTQAQLGVMGNWKRSLDRRYEQYAPVGSTLKRKNRLISFTEQTYLSILEALNTARLRQKNLQMTSATLKIINPPVLPIGAEPTKRKFTVIAAYFATLIFLLAFFALLEILDRTLRDKVRAERITGGRVIGAFPAPGKIGQQRFQQQYRESAISNLTNSILNYFSPTHQPNVLNILSTDAGDGKSLITEQLAAYLRHTGMKVCVASWNKDFNATQRDYLLASRPEQFIQPKEGEPALSEADVLLIEYPPLSKHSIPAELLRNASLNLLIAPANRTWKDTDQLLYEKSVKLAGNTPVVFCLNYAKRDVVESFTGLLPPYTRSRKLGYQIGQFGFTAVK